MKKLSMVNLHNRAQSINTTGPLGQSQTNENLDNFKSDKVDETARIDTMQISKISREIHL